LNEGDSFDIEQTFPQRIKVEQTARAMRAGGFYRQVDFTILGDINVLNDVQFGVWTRIVGVVP